MKSLKTAVLLLAVGVGFSATADDRQIAGTGLFIEPGLTYQQLSSNVDYSSPLTNSSAVANGFGLVVRGGIHIWEQFFVAADARYALLRYEDNANHLSSSATSWDIAPVVGYQIPHAGLRVWVEYVLGGELDPDGANGIDQRFEDPTGWRVGAGLKLSIVSVNIEWQHLHYGSTSYEGGFAGGTSSSTTRFGGDGLIASVTFPFEFQ